jgi:hypothetical protein
MTSISIAETGWQLNGEITYTGAKAEGLLMNVRMVNATFEDRNRSDFDSDANTQAFMDHIADYGEHGIRAFTLCLQGGMPGYEDALNSAFEPDGSLREGYLARVERVIRACDEIGIAVILGCFYQRQDQLLQDADAVELAAVNAVRWVGDRRFENVVIEVANEHAHRGFTHDIIRRPDEHAELILRVKKANPDLIVSTSGMGSGRKSDAVAEAVDFIIIHFNNTDMADVSDRIEAMRKFGKAIICNEDTKIGKRGAEVASLCVEHGCSWGLMHREVNQYQPLEFAGAADDPVVYARLRELTQ